MGKQGYVTVAEGLRHKQLEYVNVGKVRQQENTQNNKAQQHAPVISGL